MTGRGTDRPYVVLKIAMSLDGRVVKASEPVTNKGTSLELRGVRGQNVSVDHAGGFVWQESREREREIRCLEAEARQDAHQLRADSHAIMVGVGLLF